MVPLKISGVAYLSGAKVLVNPIAGLTKGCRKLFVGQEIFVRVRFGVFVSFWYQKTLYNRGFCVFSKTFCVIEPEIFVERIFCCL